MDPAGASNSSIATPQKDIPSSPHPRRCRNQFVYTGAPSANVENDGCSATRLTQNAAPKLQGTHARAEPVSFRQEVQVLDRYYTTLPLAVLVKRGELQKKTAPTCRLFSADFTKNRRASLLGCLVDIILKNTVPHLVDNWNFSPVSTGLSTSASAKTPGNSGLPLGRGKIFVTFPHLCTSLLPALRFLP